MTGTASRPARPAAGAYRPRRTPRPASRPAPPTRTAAAAAVGTYTSSGWGEAPLEIYAQVQKRVSRTKLHLAFDELLASAVAPRPSTAEANPSDVISPP